MDSETTKIQGAPVEAFSEKAQEMTERTPDARERVGAFLNEFLRREVDPQNTKERFVKDEAAKVLEDIQYALEKTGDSKDDEFNLVVAYQGLQEISENGIDVAGLQEAVKRELVRDHCFEENAIETFQDLDAKLAGAKEKAREVMEMDSEKFTQEEAASAAKNIEHYQALQEEIKSHQQAILAQGKSFRQSLLEKIYQPVRSSLEAAGHKVDTALANIQEGNIPLVHSLLSRLKEAGERQTSQKLGKGVAIGLGSAAVLLLYGFGSAISEVEAAEPGQKPSLDEFRQANPELASAVEENVGKELAAPEVQPSEPTPEETIAKAQAKIKQLAREATNYPVESKEAQEIADRIGAFERIIQIESKSLKEVVTEGQQGGNESIASKAEALPEKEASVKSREIEPTVPPEQLEQMRDELSKKISGRYEEYYRMAKGRTFFAGETRANLDKQLETIADDIYHAEAKLADVQARSGGFPEYSKLIDANADLDPYQVKLDWMMKAYEGQGNEFSPQEKEALTKKAMDIAWAIRDEANRRAEEVESKISSSRSGEQARAFVAKSDAYRNLGSKMHDIFQNLDRQWYAIRSGR